MLRLTSDCYCLSKEKIEDVSSTLLFSLVVEYTYYQEGILIRQLWGNQFTYTLVTLSLPSSGVCGRESFSLPLPLFSAHCFFPAVVPLSGAVVPLGLVAHKFCSSGCTAASGGGTATMLCKCWGGGSVHAPLKYRSRFCFDAVLRR